MPSKAEAMTTREILETHRRRLKEGAGDVDLDQALRLPVWRSSSAPGAELHEEAELGELILYATKTTDAVYRMSPGETWRFAWNVMDEDGAFVAGGGVDSMEEAREFAYLAYQSYHGFIRGGDA